MRTIEQCLEQIESIRAVAEGYEAPYVARSRIGRLVLSIVTLVCEECELKPPNIPARIHLPPDLPEHLSKIGLHCNQLLETSRGIVQPSEPLDVRWRRGWTRLLDQMAQLESELKALRGLNAKLH